LPKQKPPILIFNGSGLVDEFEATSVEKLKALLSSIPTLPVPVAFFNIAISKFICSFILDSYI
jgi:hypothetical protein